MSITLSEEEKELITFGLQMRRNYIETSNALLSATDAKAMGQEKKLQILGVDQCSLIIKLVNLIDKINDRKQT